VAIVELKAVEHPVFLLQAAKYWLPIRRHLEQADFPRYGYFSSVALQANPPLAYLVAPALRCHPATEILLKLSASSRWKWCASDWRSPGAAACALFSVSHSWYLAFAFRLRPLPARRVILLVHFERLFLVNFSVKIRHQNQVSLIDVSGHLTFFEVGALGSSIQSLLKERRKNILLNLSGLAYLDSSGIGELARIYVAVVKQGGAMKVIGLTPKVEEVLKITHLSQVFQEFPDEQSALRSFPANS